MSPTLLEGVMVIVLLVVAWQIGIILAPLLVRSLRTMRNDIESAVDEIQQEEGNRSE